MTNNPLPSPEEAAARLVTVALRDARHVVRLGKIKLYDTGDEQGAAFAASLLEVIVADCIRPYAAEAERLRRIIDGMAKRIADQSELLSRRAAKEALGDG